MTCNLSKLFGHLNEIVYSIFPRTELLIVLLRYIALFWYIVVYYNI